MDGGWLFGRHGVYQTARMPSRDFRDCPGNRLSHRLHDIRRRETRRPSPGRCGAFNMKPVAPGMKHFLQQKPSLTSKLLGAVLGGLADGHADFDMQPPP